MSAPAVFEGVRRFRFAPLLAATVLTVLLLWLFGTVADVLLLLFLAILLSLYLGAVADAITRRTRLPRRVSLFLAVALTIAGVTGLVWLLVPPVVEQTQALVRVLPAYVGAWERGIYEAVRRVPGVAETWRPENHRLLKAVYEQGAALFADLVPKVIGIGHGVINVISVGVMSLYLALRPEFYREWLIALFPPVHRDLVRDVLRDLAVTLRSWIVGQLLGMFILAALTAVGLYVLGVPYWLTFGVFTGAVAVIPFFGTFVSSVLPALFVLAGPDGGTRALAVIALGIVIHVIEGQFVLPLITARRIKRVPVPPVLSIMAVLVVGKLLGPAGLLVAVPTLAATLVIVRRILSNRIYEGQGFRRATRDQPLVLRVPPADGEGVLVAPTPRVDMIALAERARARRTA
ncbi:AI-2E family transporter [Roseisolibacter sp. H3M3-2]|uniref:AI-2E family transporter n=1 Tax=Roseisolibacter sp. H3M3-2 TaxID=3031323 RepID=UPI0023DC4A37|nr:AI-2E family transporter [Roseisolibacter sp. H3M3-2]MDF1504316.1 AI-2E family transporter [Roseisolibacter sp. H3M3-2]